MIKIIAVDDDPAFLTKLGQKTFPKDDKEFQLVATLNHLEAEDNVKFLLEKVKTLEPDVVLMDLSFSMVDRPTDFGIELVKRIREKFPEQKIIMLVNDQDKSDPDSTDKILRSFSAGAVAYLGKRELDMCREAIQEVIHGELYISPETTRRMLHGITPEADAARKKYGLSPRHIEVLYFLSLDLDIAQVAAKMRGSDGKPLTIHAVNFNLRNIRKKMIADGQGGTLHGLVAKALRERVIE